MLERGERLSLIQRLGKGMGEVGSEAEEIALMPVTYAKALRERKVRADGITWTIIIGGGIGYLLPPSLIATGVITQNIGIVDLGVVLGVTEGLAVLSTAFTGVVTGQPRLKFRETLRNTPPGTLINL